MENKWNNEKRYIRDLIPASYNPRRMTEKQNEDLKKSLSKFGLAEIPVINKDNTILAGHQRIRLCADIYGLDYEIDVRVADEQLSDQDAREYNIRSNKNTGEWDFDIMANEFNIEDLKEWGFEDKDFGNDFDDVENTDTQSEEQEEKLVTCPNCSTSFKA